ncbi:MULTISPECIES: acyl carrier protein [Cyanophyceae]|uniref:Acyl carrier protein n=1 Tax=Stenomitos frigidus AS-A4 TaxID=2933935 RepID=A0ABV0KRV1_9CYAN|nr:MULTISPECIES: acyl carrier protein [Cyanophyceae]
MQFWLNLSLLSGLFFWRNRLNAHFDNLQLETMQKSSRTEKEIQNWLISYLSTSLGIDSTELDITSNLERYGLDSLAAVGMTSELEDWLGHEVDPTITHDYPTIASISQYLAKR